MSPYSVILRAAGSCYLTLCPFTAPTGDQLAGNSISSSKPSALKLTCCSNKQPIRSAKMEKTAEVGQSSEASCVSWHFLNPQFHIRLRTVMAVYCLVCKCATPGAREIWGDNEIHKSPTEVPGCGLGCLETLQTSSDPKESVTRLPGVHGR